MKSLLFLLFFLTPFGAWAEFAPINSQAIKESLDKDNYESLKQYGLPVMDSLMELYSNGDVARKTKVASAMYYLSYKSESARELLLKDAHTPDRNLRLQVQWALGRVSADETVVKVLLDNMRNDPNPLFRDKAACALAHDQIHLSEKQKVILLEGVIGALQDEKEDVKRIAGLVLQIQTGQTRDYESWLTWIKEYRANIYGAE